MASKKTTRAPSPDTRRDFETGTVNPGPGMAPPHRADDIPAGSMSGTSGAQDRAGTCRTAESDARKGQKKATDGGCCECG
jgi:hypothetical protein